VSSHGNEAEIKKQQAQDRIKKGIMEILGLHTPYELSAICGTLKLKVQQVKTNSLDQIVTYAYDGGLSKRANPERLLRILQFCWEGALYEYLRSIGHPVHNQVLDPKATVMQIWDKGGFLNNDRSFTPYFVAREVKKRYQKVRDSDILVRLEELRRAQEHTKNSEHLVMAEHDYTNILEYFHHMSELRRLETATRDYLIGELEMTRGKIHSYDETAHMHRKQMAQCEKHMMDLAEHLNEKLGHFEFMYASQVRKSQQTEAQLQRMLAIADSYIESHQSRQVSMHRSRHCNN
jgi:hypothetical protein